MNINLVDLAKQHKWLVGCVALALLLLAMNYCHGASLTRTQAAGVALDSTYRRDTTARREVVTHTDSVLATKQPSIPTDTARKLIRDERAGCTKVVTGCEARVANLQHQVALLQPPRLKVFAEGDYLVPGSQALLSGTLRARVGVALRVGSELWAYGAREQPITGQGVAGWEVGIRKELRIF